MAEKTKTKSKTVVCALCDKAIDGKPVVIDDDPYHADCAKAMSQSSDEADDEESDDEDEGDEDEEDEEEEARPAPKKGKAVAKKAAPVEDDEDEDEDEDEEPAPKKKAKAVAAPAKKAKAPVVEDDDEDDEDEADDEDEEEEEEPAPRKKAAAAVPAKKSKRAAADYEEEEEPVKPPKKAKTAAAPKAKAAPAVDNSGWGNPAREGSKRYFIYQAMKEVDKAALRVADGAGKPENIVKRAKRLHRDWAKQTRTTLSEKDQDYSSMNVSWIHNNADSLGLVTRHNEEQGTYRVLRAKVSDDD